MKKRVWMGIALLAFLGAGVLAFMTGKDYFRKEEAKKQYEDMREKNKKESQSSLTQENETKEAKETEENKAVEIPINFAELQEKNPDIYAWITIPETEIDYPIVQSAMDNEYYLDHSAEKTESVSGAIFSENYNALDFEDYITVLYGHNMRDGSMFAGLHEYEDSEYMKKHEDVIIYTPDAILKYKIFAAYMADDKHVLLYYNQGETEENRKAYIDEIMDQRTMKASLNTAVSVDENSKILTLSTCHRAGKNYRYLVQACLQEKTQ